MKQFASDIERSTPEPYWPVMCTAYSLLSSRARMPRWYSVQPDTLRSTVAAGTRGNINVVSSVRPV